MAKLIKGVNDLATLFPEVAAEWDYEKNYPLRPEDVSAHTHQKFFWICELKHSYKARVSHRTRENRTGCPYCAGNKVLKGFNDLSTLYPELIKEWDYEKNSSLKPENFSAGSHQIVWWICELGHSYPASIASRTRKKNSSCPYCSGRLPIKGETDLLTVFPEIAAEWDYKKNYPLRPEDFTAHSNKRMWWICKLGHSYPASINDRTDIRSMGCPYCSGRLPIKGETDLLTVFPEIAAEWDYQKNYPLRPEDFTAHSDNEVWWICELEHSYLARISSRTRKKNSSCPYCSGRLPIKGETDLLTVFPKIAAEWDYQKNYPLRPEDFTYCSHQKVWWICELGHSYPAVIKSRTYKKGTGCPYCSGRLPIKGENDLMTLHPDICENWDYSRNKKTPDEYLPNSRSYAYWKCHKCGYTYRRRIIHEIRSIGCDNCQ